MANESEAFGLEEEHRPRQERGLETTTSTDREGGTAAYLAIVNGTRFPKVEIRISGAIISRRRNAMRFYLAGLADTARCSRLRWWWASGT
jgi:hypothetical protein